MATRAQIDRFLNKRGPKTFILTIILFGIGVSSYLVEKTLEAGGWGVLLGIILVWAVLYFTRIDEFIFK